MIIGDPYRFAIWIEYVPQWGATHKNGLFYFLINGNMYPEDIRTATLSVDLWDIIDKDSALVATPKNEVIFGLSTQDAFYSLFDLTYPEPTEDNEYPDQILDYCISPSNISDSGSYFFAVANENFVRIIGGKTQQLVKSESGDRNEWVSIESPHIEDIILSKNDINKIIIGLKEFSCSIFK